MENMLFDQTAQLLAIIVIVLALCLGLIFYFWSQQLFKKIELMVSKMKQNVDNLEYLSQYIYESAYFNMKERGMVNQNKDSAPSGEIVNNLKKVIEEIQNLRESQIEIKQKLNEKFSSYKSSEQIQNTMPTNPDTILVQSLSPKEEEKYEKIRELIIMYLKDLGSEKGQVTAQDLVYTMPNQYSLADIYRTLEIMKERNQISWLDKRINPQSVLTLP
ncbi:MAG: hypothetical protein KBI07_07800 [Candidatus Atribacteria bacterium]|nr:hypothetical protein [Candidatus Atribacteria bacterium]